MVAMVKAFRINSVILLKIIEDTLIIPWILFLVSHIYLSLEWIFFFLNKSNMCFTLSFQAMSLVVLQTYQVSTHQAN
jgi:hypothetical protein